MVLSYERKLRRHKEYKKQICDGKGRIMEKHKHERSTFSGKIGFVLSAAGASVGLGNIWRFPYLAAKYGGGIFLLIYIILALTFGYSMIVAETALGRMTKKSPLGAFGTFGKSKWLSLGGWINAIIPVLIVPYYSVIGGWVIKYLVEYVKGGSQTLAEDGYFSAFIADGFSTETCFLFFTLLTLVIIGAINWGLIGFFRFDLVAFIFGNMSWFSRIIYALVGLGGLYLISLFGRIRSVDQA
jgi:uncharacterized membrane protein YuzA (DUF378 family)